MQKFWIRVTDGERRMRAIFAGRDVAEAHMSALLFFKGTNWRVVLDGVDLS